MSSEKAVQTGILVILSAPSGCGKTTILEKLLKRHSSWVRSVSATTRRPRHGEKQGEDYLFVSEEEFEAMRSHGDFLESANVYGQDYGTPKSFVLDQLKQKDVVILAIDVQGAKKVMSTRSAEMPCLSIFVLPPSMKTLRERLEGRKTEAPEEVERRLEVAGTEIKAAGDYDHTVVNQNLDQTVTAIEKIITSFQESVA